MEGSWGTGVEGKGVGGAKNIECEAVGGRMRVPRRRECCQSSVVRYHTAPAHVTYRAQGELDAVATKHSGAVLLAISRKVRTLQHHSTKTKHKQGWPQKQGEWRHGGFEVITTGGGGQESQGPSQPRAANTHLTLGAHGDNHRPDRGLEEQLHNEAVQEPHNGHLGSAKTTGSRT